MYDIQSIKWIKNVSSSDQKGAYLENADIFKLHYPNSKKGNILLPQIGEIILIWQKIENIPVFTHLVTPIDNIIHENTTRNDYCFSREVKVVTSCLKTPYIKRSDSILRDINFSSYSYGSAVQLIKNKYIADQDKLYQIQLDIYSLFLTITNKKVFLSPIDIVEQQATNIINDVEGEKKLVQHYAYERSNKLIQQKKENAIKNKSYFCEICNFDFLKYYGELFIECHHIIPMNQDHIRNTTLDDLKLVCSNCHRMLHRKISNAYLSCEELKEHIINKKEES